MVPTITVSSKTTLFLALSELYILFFSILWTGTYIVCFMLFYMSMPMSNSHMYFLIYTHALGIG